MAISDLIPCNRHRRRRIPFGYIVPRIHINIQYPHIFDKCAHIVYTMPVSVILRQRSNIETEKNRSNESRERKRKGERCAIDINLLSDVSSVYALPWLALESNVV